MRRTRIKICGITREEDLRSAVSDGADAVGFVFYAKSPRYLPVARADRLLRCLPAFVTSVGLFVNEAAANVRAVLETLPLQFLQFHGDEDEAYCSGFGLPYIKAARVRPGLDLLEYATSFGSAAALLLDADVEGYGGGGRAFDWSLVPAAMPLPLVLSGGLNADNVARAMAAVRPWAVDVSSGVEAAPGIKDAEKIARFIAEVRIADA